MKYLPPPLNDDGTEIAVAMSVGDHQVLPRLRGAVVVSTNFQVLQQRRYDDADPADRVAIFEFLMQEREWWPRWTVLHGNVDPSPNTPHPRFATTIPAGYVGLPTSDMELMK